MQARDNIPWATRESTPVERTLDLRESASSVKQESGFAHVCADSEGHLMKASFDGSAERFIGCVGRWFAKEFAGASADDKLEVLNRVRPVLRHAGFDLCDSEFGEPVGCECCLGESEFGRYKGRIPTGDDRVIARIWQSQPDIDVRITLTGAYEFGARLGINYCPMCGRRLGVAPDGNDGD